MEHWRNGADRRNSSAGRQIYPSGSLLAISLIRTDLESKLGLRGDRREATASQQGRSTLQS